MGNDKGLYNTPDLEPEFAGAKSPAPAPKDLEHSSNIATKAELDTLIETRNTPTSVPDYTIDGSTEQAVHENEHIDREALISNLENKLSQRNLTREFSRDRE